MSKKLFSDSEIKILLKNKYVKTVGSKGITYTDEFKLLFISEYNMGKLPYKIFGDAGFDAKIIGKQRIWSCSKRWRKSYKDTGEIGLRDTRKFNSGRPLERELTNEELLAKKDAEIAYWKAEAELLKKIERRERQVKNGKLATSLVFKLIQEIISKYNYKNMVRHLCEVALVSRSGYYNYLNSTDKRNHREKKDLKLKELILKAINHRGYKKGSRSIKMVLEQDFHLVVNRKCIHLKGFLF
ncbi:MAG TPA: HTH domain-containing protein [Ignavibacteria bacterium]